MNEGQGSPVTSGVSSATPEGDFVPLHEALSKRSRRRFLGLTADDAVKYFFGGNATIAIVVLFLIMALLVKEGIGFVPLNHFNLSIYREAGLEYVDQIRGQVKGHTDLGRTLQTIRINESQALLAKAVPLEQVNAAMAPLDAYMGRFDDAIAPHNGLLSDLSDVATGIKEKAQENLDRLQQREILTKGGLIDQAKAISIVQLDYARETKPLRDAFPQYRQLNVALSDALQQFVADPDPALQVAADRVLLADFKVGVGRYIGAFPEIERQMAEWDALKPVPFYRSITSFLFGPDWITASSWQDWFGVLPLFFGSLAVSAVALAIAVPFSIGAAIYINQIATRWEQRLIKPYIEFIAAIPSVVLGFFGIAVLGTALRSLSAMKFLAWIPFFPMAERLNIFTAGCLLALMATPTIFTLAEDALNNVPRAFVEASTALGATRWQTISRIIIPASLSGVVSAILLGLGRVIGETMVVLLCIGGRIQIPDFLHHGLAAFFEPAQAMTGIIAQEMGEAPAGSILRHALFMDGILLFLMALVINYGAQMVVKRYRISIG